MNKENVDAIEVFVNTIDVRDNKMEKHCDGESWAELANYPEERDWYSKNIGTLDDMIVKLANLLIKEKGIPCEEQKDIHDVYENEYLKKLYRTEKEKKLQELEETLKF